MPQPHTLQCTSLLDLSVNSIREFANLLIGGTPTAVSLAKRVYHKMKVTSEARFPTQGVWGRGRGPPEVSIVRILILRMKICIVFA